MKLLFILFLLPFSMACTHLGRDNSQKYTVPQSKITDENAPLKTEVASKKLPSSLTKESNSRELNSKESDSVDTAYGKIPSAYNEKVKEWLNYFQNRGRKHMERYLSRMPRYENLMKKVLRDHKLPEDLLYIALIESGFNSRATSRAGAVGYWQFIRGTGRRYDLKINPYVDERRDPIYSTVAASRYLSGLYNLFGSWYLAIASYNVGENRIKNLVMKYHTRDFWTLAKSKRLPRETADYVPKFIAATLIAKNPDKYGFGYVEFQTPFEFDKVISKKPVNMKVFARNLGVSYSDFKALNPIFKGTYAPNYKNGQVVIRVPKGKGPIAYAALEKSYAQKMRFIVSRGSKTYRVRRGDTLYGIARRFGTSINALRQANNMGRRSLIRYGQRLKIPGKILQQVNRRRPQRSTTSASRTHVVRRGDTLIYIAKRYKTTISQLVKVNNIRYQGRILIGQRLIIPD